MNSQKIAVESLAMDLKRIALGLHRGSTAMAERFTKEALNRINEISNQGFDDSHLKELVFGIRSALANPEDRIAEDALMYSTLFQNFARKKLA